MTIDVIRFLRPQTNTYAQNFGTSPSNLGGVTLLFEMDYNLRKVAIKFAICPTTINFNKKDGTFYAKASPIVRVLDLDRFQKFSDLKGGFVDGYLSLLETESIIGSLDDREKLLVKKVIEQNLGETRS